MKKKKKESTVRTDVDRSESENAKVRANAEVGSEKKDWVTLPPTILNLPDKKKILPRPLGLVTKG